MVNAKEFNINGLTFFRYNLFYILVNNPLVKCSLKFFWRLTEIEWDEYKSK